MMPNETSAEKLFVVFALIHNNNIVRNTYLRPRLTQLVNSVESLHHTKFIEISYQPPLVPHSSSMAFLRDLLYWKIGREWQAYRMLDTPRRGKDICCLFKQLYRKYFTQQCRDAEKWCYNGAIEMFVTDKHIRAWERFLDTNANVLICFEDDAILKDDSEIRLKALLDVVRKQGPDMHVYADLAGGFAFPDLRIERLEECQDDHYRYYKKPVTNTACSYLLTRPLVSNFHDILIKKPYLRLIGVDWMMNKLLMEMDLKSNRFVCLHADPTIFEHGSASGVYTPWSRNCS